MVVGITGSIGSGKTAVADILRSKGFVVYDSDREARRLQNENEEIRQKTCELLGNEAYIANELNRAFVAKAVFTDKIKLQKLNEIIHPKVKTDFENWVKNHSSESILFLETAILFESGFNTLVDKILLITASESTRIERVMNRNNFSREEILSRIKNQQNQYSTDFVIHNEGNFVALEKEVERILVSLSKNSSANSNDCAALFNTNAKIV